MAVDTVQFTLNGQTYDLNYDSSTGKYSAVITAPSISSWNQTNHKYAGQVTATDEAGNVTVATVADFTALGLRVLEKVKPNITPIYPTSGSLLSSATPTVQWTVTDTGSGIDTSTISLTIDNGSPITTGITRTSITGGYTCTHVISTALSEGNHTLKFNVSDNDGNAAETVSVTFMVDLTPPVLVVTTPVNGLITNQQNLTVSGTSNDSSMTAVTVTVKVNDGDPQTLTMSGSAFSGTVSLSEGENTLVFVSTDAAGRTTTVSRTVTLDTVAPSILNVTLTPNPVDAGATYTISVTVNDG